MTWKNWLASSASSIQLWACNMIMYNSKIKEDYGNKERTVLLEKPLYFDPFGQIEFAHFGHNIITPCKVLV